MNDRLEHQIRERAYLLWEAEGRPEGRDLEFWARAETEISAQRAGARKSMNKPTAPRPKTPKGKAGKPKLAATPPPPRGEAPPPAAPSPGKRPEPAAVETAPRRPVSKAAKPAAPPKEKKRATPVSGLTGGTGHSVGECSWIDGTPGSGRDWSFCGRPTVPGKAYCEEHIARVYNRPRNGPKEPAPAAKNRPKG